MKKFKIIANKGYGEIDTVYIIEAETTHDAYQIGLDNIDSNLYLYAREATKRDIKEYPELS